MLLIVAEIYLVTIAVIPYSPENIKLHPTPRLARILMSVQLSEVVPNRILLIRLGAVRDGLMTIPLAVDAKRLWPDSTLSWVVDGEIEQVLKTHPRIDEVIRIESNWLRRPGTWRPLKRMLSEKQFDLVLDPQGVSKSAMLGWLSGAPVRLGFEQPYSKEFAAVLFTKRISPSARHRVDMYRQLLTPWTDIEIGDGSFELPPDACAASKVGSGIEKLFGCKQPWYVIYPGAIWKTATWPMDRFSQVARHMLQNHRMPGLVVWCDADEKLVASVIAEQSDGAVEVAPQYGLRDLIELCRQTNFVITGDSNLLQIASSVDTPVISLHGPTWADEFGCYRFNEFAIQSPFPRLSNRSMRSGANSAMQAIETEEVIYYVERLIKHLRHRVERQTAAVA